MRIAILIVTLLSIVLIAVLFNQYEGLIRQVAKHPSFTFGQIEQVSIKPTFTDSVFTDGYKLPVYHFGSDDLTKKMIVLPGLGFYLDDWFSVCESFRNEGYHVITFPMEFSNTSKEYTWGVTDGKLLAILLDSLKLHENVTITAFDFAVLALDKLTVRPETQINFINPRSTRSDYLSQLADLSFGFSLSNAVSNIVSDLSARMTVTDSLSIKIDSNDRFFFNPNITVSPEFLKFNHKNFSENWEYGKINHEEIVSVILKK